MRVWRLVGCLFGVVLTLVVSAPTAVFADENQSSGSVSITGAVEVRTTLIVDQQGHLQKIFSNGYEPGTLVAEIGKVDGPQFPLNQTLVDTYINLKPSLSFKYGYIYSTPAPKSVPVQPVPTNIKKILFSASGPAI